MVSSRSSQKRLTNGMPHAGRDVPVDGANVVAGYVFADFVELHPATLEHRVVFAGEMFVHQRGW